jgi:F0F1-type ATP synthase assembly protein I
MTKKAAETTTDHARGNALSLGTLGVQFLDTTWRVAVPVLIFAGIGIFADIKVGTKPWLTLLGVVIGFVFAGALIKRLLAQVNSMDKSADKSEDKS